MTSTRNSTGQCLPRTTAALGRRCSSRSPWTLPRIGVAAGALVLELACGREILTRAVADASSLPFSGESADAVVCQFGLVFVPDKRAALAEVRRVLRPGGMLLFSVWDAIESNHLPFIAHTTIAKLFGDDARNFYEVPFRVAGRSALVSMLGEASFGDVTLDVVRKVGESATARAVATGLIYGNPILEAIRERGTVEPDAIVDAIAARIADECGAGPTRARMQALVVTARPEWPMQLSRRT